MAVLVGQEGEGTGATLTGSAENAWSWQFEALHTGKVTALHVTFSGNGLGTALKLALQADEAGKPKEGVLVEGEISGGTTVTEKGTQTVSVAETEVVAGTKYWLSLLTTGGNWKLKEGSTTANRKSGTKHTKISEYTSANWAAEEKKGPVAIWGSGTEGSTKVEAKATGALLLTGTAKGIAAQKVEGKATGALLLGGTAKGTTVQKVTGKATGALLLTGTSTGTGRAVVSGKATGVLLLTGTAHGAAAGALKGKASGAILLTGSSTGTTRSVVMGSATGALLLTGKAKGGKVSVVKGKATGVLLLTGTATAKGGATGPCLMAVDNFKAVTMTITNRKATLQTVVNRKATRQLVVNL